MNINEIDFSKTLDDEKIYQIMMSNYDLIGKDWIAHQWNWMNNIYSAFNDHYKYLIVISLVERTMQFYDQVDITYSYDQFYSKINLEIEKFSITELCEKLDLPKETVRRKVLELEKLGVLKRENKKIIIDRSAFPFTKPANQIKVTSKYIDKISKILNQKKIYTKKINSELIEKIIKKNFTLCWKWYFKMQIPIVIGYTKMFNDLATFHIWGTVCLNQAFNCKKIINGASIFDGSQNYMHFNSKLVNGVGNKFGISAMSLSDMTKIPRATVLRKCKFLIDNNFFKIDEKKHYALTSFNIGKVLPYQKEIFKNKAKFLRKTLNLILISK